MRVLYGLRIYGYRAQDLDGLRIWVEIKAQGDQDLGLLSSDRLGFGTRNATM